MIPEHKLQELRDQLRLNPEKVCRELLPDGKKEGSSWRCGNVHGKPGRSLDVALEGENAGLWLDHESGEGGDLIELSQLNRGETFSEAARRCASIVGVYLGGNTGAPKIVNRHKRDRSSPHPSEKVDWNTCVSRMDQAKRDELVKWRGYDHDFAEWAVENGIIGVFKGGFAFPVHNEAGQVVRIHYRLPDGRWAYTPTGKGTAPLVIGDPANAAYTLVCESQWDALALLYILGAHKPENVGRYAAIVTRGATSNTDLSGFGAKRLIICPQNDPEDKRNERTGHTPDEQWLRRVLSNLGPDVEVSVYRAPRAYEDPNEYIKEAMPEHLDVFRAIIDGADFKSPSEHQEDLEEVKEECGIRIPDGVFPVPAGEVSYSVAGQIIFSVIARSETMFIRGGKVFEVLTDEYGIGCFEPVAEERFCSLLEKHGYRIARREVVSKKDLMQRIVWRTATFPKAAASILLQSNEARILLPTIRQLVGCEVITPQGKVLGKGYHPHAGGTYVTQGFGVVDVPLEVAAKALLGLLKDFDFATKADKSRAVATLLAPAMKMGGLINDDFPLDVAEADRSQAGKTYRQSLVANLYGETPTSITPAKGGVGSLDESISAALIRGRIFINLGNFRGRLDSPILEESLRGMGRVHCRALRTSAEVDSRPFHWQLSTNGAEMTRDVANRSIITRIRKREDGFEYTQYPEGDLLAHVRANRRLYLGSVFSVIRHWLNEDKPRTTDTRHDFRTWAQSMDWIVQRVFDLPPLLDGHVEEQLRTANPALQWLREVCIYAKSIGRTSWLTASDMAEIAEDGGIQLPGGDFSREKPGLRVGKLLGNLFREMEDKPIIVDGFLVRRVTAEHPSNQIPRKSYHIERAS